MKEKKTRKQLEHEITILKAQMMHNYCFADKDLKNFHMDRLMGSGVLLQMYHLNQTTPTISVVLCDGINDDLHKELHKAILYSFNLKNQFTIKE